MFKKILMTSMAVIPIFAFVSCVQEVGDLSLNGRIFIDETILKNNQTLDRVFNIKQLNMLFNKTNFFQNKEKQSIQFEGSRIDSNNNIVIKINDFEYQLSNLNKMAKYNVNFDTKTFVEQKNNLNYDDLFVSYSLAESKEANFGLEIESQFNLPKGFYAQAYPDMAWIINSIVKNLGDDYYQNLLGNFINLDRIRALQWNANEEQKSYLEWSIKLNLNYFHFNDALTQIENVKITSFNQESTNHYSFTLDLLDNANNSLISKKSQQTKFYIGNFRNQLRSPDLKLLNYEVKIPEPEIMFSEYLNNASLEFGPNFYNYKDFDDLIVTTTNNKRFTAKGFKYFLRKYYQNFINLKVPEFKKGEDLRYEIINIDQIEYSDIGLKAKNILKVLVRVYKKDGSVKDYPWYSFDFNSHQHLFKGFHIQDHLDLDSVNNLWSWSNEKYFEIQNSDFVPVLNKGLEPNDFYQKHILDFLNLESYRYAKTILPQFNKIKENIEANELEYDNSYIDYLETFLNIDILSILIGNNANDFESGIDSVKIKYLGYDKTISGTILLSVDFLNNMGKSILNKHNSQKIIKFGGFKGFDFTQINLAHKINNTANKSVNYFFDNKIKQLPQIAKWKGQ